jgi:hypothetical protein
VLTLVVGRAGTISFLLPNDMPEQLSAMLQSWRTALQFLTLSSAIFGAVGSVLVFYGTFAMKPPSSAIWGSDESIAEDERVAERNRVRRPRLQA